MYSVESLLRSRPSVRSERHTEKEQVEENDEEKEKAEKQIVVSQVGLSSDVLGLHITDISPG
jgi:hypothetical protein